MQNALKIEQHLLAKKQQGLYGLEVLRQQAKADGNQVGQNEAEAYRAEAALQRDQLTIFSGSLGKFVRNYEYVAQLLDFGDPLVGRCRCFVLARRLFARKMSVVTRFDAPMIT